MTFLEIAELIFGKIKNIDNRDIFEFRLRIEPRDFDTPLELLATQ